MVCVGQIMLIHDLSEPIGSIGSETRAYYDYDKASLNLVQVLYKGPKVVSHSSICLTPAQFAEIVTTISSLHIQGFMNKYKME